MPFSAPLVVATTAARGTGHLIRAVPEVPTPVYKKTRMPGRVSSIED